MLAPVHARSNAPNDNVVGRPIFAFAQSACVRNAVAAMKRSGTIAEMQKNCQFLRITGAGLRESHVHDVEIMREAPNYREGGM